jgi:LemA protein
MEDRDPALEAYVRKLMDYQYKREEDSFTEDQLRKIALDMGLSEEEFEKSRKRAAEHRDRGLVFVEQANWEDAVWELEQAAALDPNDVDAARGLGRAYIGMAELTEDNSLFDKAEMMLKRVFRLDPRDPEAMKVSKTLRNRSRVQKNESKDKEKKSKMTRRLLLAGIVLLFFFSYVNMYNGLVSMEENVNQQWAQVENVYQRRADLIPNLAEAVRGVSRLEKETFESVAKARAGVSNLKIDPADLTQEKLDEFAARQGDLSAALGRLIAVAEDYPDLKFPINFQQFQDELAGTENRISTERRRFNQGVETFNSSSRRFPYNLMGFGTKPYFKAEKGADKAPQETF